MKRKNPKSLLFCLHAYRRNEIWHGEKENRKINGKGKRKLYSSHKRNNHEDVKGFCNSESVERVAEPDYVRTPGRYVGLVDKEDDFDFAERFTGLKAEYEAQLKEEAELNERIADNLPKIRLNDDR